MSSKRKRKNDSDDNESSDTEMDVTETLSLEADPHQRPLSPMPSMSDYAARQPSDCMELEIPVYSPGHINLEPCHVDVQIIGTSSLQADPAQRPPSPMPTLSDCITQQPSDHEELAIPVSSNAGDLNRESCYVHLHVTETSSLQGDPSERPPSPVPTASGYHRAGTPPPEEVYFENGLFDFPQHLLHPDEEYQDEEILEEDVDENYSFEEQDPPIYAGAPITLHQSCVAILSLVLTFSLSGQCIQALLRLIQLHCLKANNVFQSSLYLFKKYFSYLRGDVQYEYYCSVCFSQVKKSVGCTKPKCDKKAPLSCLIKVPLEHQLKTLFKRKNFHSKLQFGERLHSSTGIKDIYDGKLYRECEGKGLLGKYLELSLMWYTDGASLFQSSKISVWPVFLSILELPYAERFKKENLLVPALWCGPVQPHGNILMKIVFGELQKLRTGVRVEVEGHGEKTLKAFLLCGTGDTPARALALNMVKHNGEHSCQKCEQKGECREGCPGVRVFPYCPQEMTPRTDEALIRHGDLAANLCKAYFGVKGSTILSKITPSAIRGTSIDAMHLIYGGLTKMHLKFFIDSEFKDLQCNLDKGLQRILDNRLLSIKPPFYVTRATKSTSDLATWKINMLKAMLEYYSLPVYKGIVPEYHLEHYACLVAAVRYLNSDHITDECLSKAEILIVKYVSFFKDFYGLEHMTLTVHLLLHLVELVKEIGGLWVTSCFPLESINGVILKLVHGTRFAEQQIVSSLQMCLGLEDLVENLEDSEAKKFCQDIMTRTNKCKSTTIGPFSIIGKWKKLVSVPKYLEDPLKDYPSVASSILSTFTSMRYNKILFVSELKELCRDSSCAEFTYNNVIHVGIIKIFLRSSKCECLDCSCQCNLFAVIQQLQKKNDFKTLVPDIPVPNIHSYIRLDKFLMIPAESLQSVYVKMVVNNILYAAKKTNVHEIE